jgi:hypothetical protein
MTLNDANGIRFEVSHAKPVPFPVSGRWMSGQNLAALYAGVKCSHDGRFVGMAWSIIGFRSRSLGGMKHSSSGRKSPCCVFHAARTWSSCSRLHSNRAMGRPVHLTICCMCWRSCALRAVPNRSVSEQMKGSSCFDI